LTKQTARSHSLAQLVKALDSTEAGVKNAMTRRKISKCKDYHKKEDGTWEEIPDAQHHPKKKAAAEKAPEPEVDTIIGVAYPEPGRKEYLCRWTGFKDDHCTWEAPEALLSEVAQQKVIEWDSEHP
jgi:hypothetical protein